MAVAALVARLARAPRRSLAVDDAVDLRQIADGMVIVRHRELERTVGIADRFPTDLQMYAS